MNENETYVANAIRLWVWSGLHSPTTAKENIYDIIEEGDDEQMLLGLVDLEFSKKHEAEESWPTLTDVEKLDAAFHMMRESGIVAVHHAGWDKSEAYHACVEQYRKVGEPPEMFGICYYTTQDVEGTIDSNVLYLGAGSTRPETEDADMARASRLICSIVREAGLEAEWNGDTKYRIKIQMKWQKRDQPLRQESVTYHTSQNTGIFLRLCRMLFRK